MYLGGALVNIAIKYHGCLQKQKAGIPAVLECFRLDGSPWHPGPVHSASGSVKG